MLTFTKRFGNPLTHKWAGGSRSPFALVRHLGRKSGKLYETPAIVARRGNQFVLRSPMDPK